MKYIRWKIVFYSLLHGIFLLILSFIWINQTRFYGDEAFLVKWTSLSKKNLFNIDPKPSPEEILFINTSGSKMLVENTDDILALVPKKDVITDRQELAHLLRILFPYKEDIQLVVIDLLFDSKSEFDSLLNIRLLSMHDKVLGVHTISGNDLPQSPIFDIPSALGNYKSPLTLFFKYPLILNGSKTLPTRMYEILSGHQIFKNQPFTYDNKKLAFPIPITDFKLRLSDFDVGFSLEQSSFNMYNLSDVLALRDIMDEEDYKELFAGKIIMIGDTENDIHNTPFGVMPGMLIVYNAFLTLLYAEHIISPIWIIFSILFFAFISYRIFTDLQVRIPPKWAQKIKSKLLLYLLNSVDEIFFLGLMTTLSYFLFNIHINILFLFFYLKILEFILRKMNL